METLKKILKWFFGGIVLLIGIPIIFFDFLIGLILSLLGLFILPPTFNLFERKTNLNLASKTKWITVCLGFAVSMVLITISGYEESQEKGNKAANKAVRFIEQGQIDSAKVYINKAKEEYNSSTNKATELEKEVEKSDSIQFAKETLAKMSNANFKKLQKNSLQKEYLDHKTLNKKFISLLKSHAHERENLVEKLEEKKRLEKLEQERKRQKVLEEKRKELVREQFSAWDGSHPALTKYIKKNMRDPDSYDHIETRFRDDGSSIYVVTKFRGANAFGGKAINSVSARVDFDGNVIEIISWD